MKYSVYIIEDAERDILEIYEYAAENNTQEQAGNLLDQIEKTIFSLEAFPMHGHTPPELERIGIYEFKEIHYNQYRIIYEMRKNDIFVYCVLDGRRELQELLQKRILR